MSVRKSVVTGGSGFVGRNLVDALVARGDKVLSIDKGGKPWRDDVEFLDSDIRDEAVMNDAFAGAETVFHNASLVHTKHNRIDDVWSVNRGGSQTVLKAAKAQHVPKLVYVSTASAVYEGRDIINGDETMPYSTISQAPYADSKIAAEKELLAANGNDIAVCSLRPHVIFGPGDNRFLPTILERAKNGKMKFQVGLGEKMSDFTYVSNLVDALLLADEKLTAKEVGGQAYFITNGEPTPFFHFVSDVLKALQLPPIKYSVPFSVAYSIAALREAWDSLRGGTLNAENSISRFAVRYMCTHHYFSIAKAQRELGYKPKVSIADGIAKTAGYIKEHGWA